MRLRHKQFSLSLRQLKGVVWEIFMLLFVFWWYYDILSRIYYFIAEFSVNSHSVDWLSKACEESGWIFYHRLKCTHLPFILSIKAIYILLYKSTNSSFHYCFWLIFTCLVGTCSISAWNVDIGSLVLYWTFDLWMLYGCACAPMIALPRPLPIV